MDFAVLHERDHPFVRKMLNRNIPLYCKLGMIFKKTKSKLSRPTNKPKTKRKAGKKAKTRWTIRNNLYQESDDMGG